MLNLPNILTLSRIFLIPVVVGFFYWEIPYNILLALSIFLLASLTDFLDGYFARRFNEVSNLGRFLDPIADKVLVAVIIFILTERSIIYGLHIIPALIILSREIIVSGLHGHFSKLSEVAPSFYLPKIKTGVQITALSFLLLSQEQYSPAFTIDLGLFLFWFSSLLTLVTGYDYLRAGLASFAKMD